MPHAAGTTPPMALCARDRRRAGMCRSAPSAAVAVFGIESEYSAVIACAAMSDDRHHAGAGSRRAASAASAPTEGHGSGGKGHCRDGLAEPRAAARRGVGVWDGACAVMMIDAFRIDRRANGVVLRTWT